MQQAKKIPVMLTGLFLAVLLVVTGCQPQAATVDAQVEAEQPATAVEVQQAQRTGIKNELVYIGQVEPQKTMHVVSRLAAEVQQVNFDIGDYVEAGDILFTVDAKDINDQIKQLQATINAQEVGVQSAEYGLQVAQEGSAQTRMNDLQQESGINAARYGSQSAQQAKKNAKDATELLESTVEQLEQQLKQAAADYAMLPDGEVSAELLRILKEEYEAARKRYDEMDADDPEREDAKEEWQRLEKRYNDAFEKSNAASALNALRSQLATARAQLDQADSGYDSADLARRQAANSLSYAQEGYEAYQDFVEESQERAIAQAELGVLSAQAAKNIYEVQLSVAQSSLNYAQVSSPISGVISSKSIEPGQLISQTTVPFTIISMDTVHIQVNVSETLINTIFAGDEVEVLVQSVSNIPFKGVVTAVSPAAGPTSTYPIRIEVENPDGLIKPGMFSQVTFVKDQRNNAFVLDKNVILTDESGSYVYVVETGLAKKRAVTTGLSNGNQIEITNGLSVGDVVVTVGQEYLHDGLAVNVVAMNGEKADSAMTPTSQVVEEEADVSEPEQTDEETTDTDDSGEDDEETEG